MEYDLRKQKRLGPAPIASFEKSFEDSATSTGTPELSRQDAVNTTPEDSDKKAMDPELSGPTATVTMTSTRISTVTMHSRCASPTRRHHQHELNDPTSKRPPPLQTVNVSVPIQSATRTTVSSGDGHYSGVATLGVNTPSTPRIDISRASSSSQHEDSRESSPDNVFEQVGTGTLQESIGLGFREEGAMDLRSSTEELYFMDPEQKKEEQEKLQQTRKSPIIFKFDEHQNYLQQHQRKDSASSEVAALLCISGRTSRISSVGSQGSAVSRLSAVSGISRSPSPHKMLLETSFCGPKPLENIVDGSIVSTVEPPTAEALEQVLLSRKHDPTQAVFAEGINIESSPKKNLANGEAAKKKPHVAESIKGATKPATSHRPLGKKVPIPTIGVRKDTAKRVVGALPSGAEYIRINLKPDYLYEDKGVAPNERIIEVSKAGKNSTEHKKPVTLSLGRDPNAIEQRLTPSSSPKPARHQALAREPGGSRSPSPAAVTVSRKSSFCSLFKPKDSPDSPHEHPRSRSKSRDRSTPQSQSGTPSKQKSVLAIFKPKRSVSKSKCSSPIDHDAATTSLEGISQVEFKFKSEPAGSSTENRSRPSSRLRYYDTPLDGKSIHIPLHTPPEEKQDRKFMPSNKEAKEPEPPPPSASSSGSSHTTMGPTPPNSAKLKPTVPEDHLPSQEDEKPPALPLKTPKLAQLEKTQRIVNLDAIQSLLDDKNDRGRTWSLEVHKHSSQESQETTSMDGSSNTITQRRKSKPSLSDVSERPSMENSIRQESYEHAVANESIPTETFNHQNNIPTTKEKKRLLFSMRLGSGSQEQIFSTQFSISKTESLSSQLSEQQSIPESPGPDGKQQLQRSDTVIRRPNDSQPMCQSGNSQSSTPSTGTAKRKPSTEDVNKPTVVGVIEKKDSSDDKRKSKTSDEEDKRTTPTPVIMRRKDNSNDLKRKSKSASEEDDSTHRHSRYIESFDVKRGIPDLKTQSRNSSDSSIKERDSRTSSREDQDPNTPVTVPQLPPKAPATERQSIMSTTDDLAESSESERDSEMDPNRIKRHLPRHIGAVEDHESTGLVSQDSFEDELPYVPTTLPEERALGVPLLSMKDRATMEVKTCPVDRPRSTTPMNPACLEEYCGITASDDPDHIPVRGEKLRISLPRKDSTKDKSQRTKSPRRVSNTSGKSWFEFAEQGLGRTSTSTTTTPTQFASPNQPDDEPPPPLPPRKPSGSSGGHWINFENIPEKRKAPKRITALPKDSSLDFTTKTPNSQPVQYNYVKPEECQCECHEVERESHKSPSLVNVDLLQQGEDMLPLLESETHDGVEPSDSSVDYSYEHETRPFQMDLSLGPNDGNVFNVSSQQLDSPDDRPSQMNDSTPNRLSANRKKKPTDSQKP